MAEKEVFFHKYCMTCAHLHEEESGDKCNECLAQGWNDDSHKPINYERSEKEAK